LENLKRRDHLGGLYIDRRIILKWVLKKYVTEVWTEFNCLRIGSIGGLL
jgi:hypothetical protein